MTWVVTDTFHHTTAASYIEVLSFPTSKHALTGKKLSLCATICALISAFFHSLPQVPNMLEFSFPFHAHAIAKFASARRLEAWERGQHLPYKDQRWPLFPLPLWYNDSQFALAGSLAGHTNFSCAEVGRAMGGGKVFFPPPTSAREKAQYSRSDNVSLFQERSCCVSRIMNVKRFCANMKPGPDSRPSSSLPRTPGWLLGFHRTVLRRLAIHRLISALLPVGKPSLPNT